MSKKGKENKETEIIAPVLSSTAGSLLGTVSADAAINKIKDAEPSGDEDITAQSVDDHDDVEVVSHTNSNCNQGNADVQVSPAPTTVPDITPTDDPDPVVIVRPEPDVVVDIVYAGPDPDPYPIDPNIDPVVCVYGPPEPEINNDIEDWVDY